MGSKCRGEGKRNKEKERRALIVERRGILQENVHIRKEKEKEKGVSKGSQKGLLVSQKEREKEKDLKGFGIFRIRVRDIKGYVGTAE